MAQLGQRLRLDLADALAGDAELSADLLERSGLAGAVKTESQADDLLLALAQLTERLLHRFVEQLAGSGIGRRFRLLVLDEVGEVAVLLLANRRVERQRVLQD